MSKLNEETLAELWESVGEDPRRFVSEDEVKLTGSIGSLDLEFSTEAPLAYEMVVRGNIEPAIKKEEEVMTNLNTHSESIHKDLWEATKDFFNATNSFENESLAAAMLTAFELIEQVNAAPETLAKRMADIPKDIKELSDFQENLIKPFHHSIATDQGSQKDTPVVPNEVKEAVQEHFRDAEWGSFEEHYSLGVINAFRAIELGKLEEFKNNFPKVVSDAKETATFFSELAEEFLK